MSNYIDNVIWDTSWNAFLKTPRQTCASLPRTTSDTVKSVNRSCSKLELSLLKALTFMEIHQATLLRNLLIMEGIYWLLKGRISYWICFKITKGIPSSYSNTLHQP